MSTEPADRVPASLPADTTQLVGRASLIDEVQAYLADRRSVLLVGPRGVGKSAIVGAVRRPDLIVVDPFAGITSPRACALRRALDRGRLVAAAARSLERRDMGNVGRIFWRFEVVRVRPLTPRQVRAVIARALSLSEGPVPVDRAWLTEAVEVAEGLPGRAVSLAGVVVARWREHRVVVPPRFALTVAWQEELPAAAGQAAQWPPAAQKVGGPEAGEPNRGPG